jgi:hypothetical protein
MVARVRGEAVQRGARQIGVLRCEKQAERGARQQGREQQRKSQGGGDDDDDDVWGAVGRERGVCKRW